VAGVGLQLPKALHFSVSGQPVVALACLIVEPRHDDEIRLDQRIQVDALHQTPGKLSLNTATVTARPMIATQIPRAL
jgi:hypothetical protein